MEVVNGVIVGSRVTHNVENGMIANDTIVSGYAARQYVLNGGSAVRTQVNTEGLLEVRGGGYAESAAINGSLAVMDVQANGVAKNAVVKNGGTLYVSAGGSAVNVNIDKTGYMYVNVTSNSYITGTSNGKTIKVADNVISNITAFSRHYVDVGQDWKAYDTIVSGYNAYNTVFTGGSAIRTTVKDEGNLVIRGGGYAESAVINGTLAVMDVQANGVAKDAVVKNGGTLYVSSGGSAVNVNIDKTGYMYVDVTSNSYITGTSNGKTIKVADNVISNITAFSRHYVDVGQDWKAYDTIVSGYGAYNTVFTGGSAIRTTVKDEGNLVIRGGGYAESAVINGKSAVMDVLANGVAKDAVVKNGGTLYVSSGGSAVNVNIDKTGYMYVNVTSNSYITGTSNGKTIKVADNVISNITAFSRHYVDVGQDWKAYDTIVSGYNAYNTVFAGGSAIRTAVKDEASLRISAGGYAGSAEINGKSATMVILSNGTAEDTVVKNGGYVSVEKGGLHKGTLNLATGTKVSVANGGTIDFTVSKRSTADTYLINNLALITGTPSYTITVDANQASGEYKLAQGAKNFNKTVTIGNGTLDYGTLSVGGGSLEYNGGRYSLVLSGENLHLMIQGNGSLESPRVTADITTPTKGNVTLSAEFGDSCVTAEYRINGGNWQSCSGKVVVTENSTVEFRGQDQKGKYSPITSYIVSNIDRVAPVITLNGNNTDRLESTQLTASVDDGSKIMYSTDNKTWKEYTSALNITSKGTWYFKATDSAGNTGVRSITFNNIISSSTQKLPVVTANTTEPTKNTVTLTVNYTDEAVTKEYSTDGVRWYNYTRPLELSQNGTCYFREKDASGKLSQIVSYTVSNIDKLAPVVPWGLKILQTGSTVNADWADASDNGTAGVIGYNIRYGQSASLKGSGTLVSNSNFTLSGLARGKWYFQIQTVDAAGNTSAWSTATSFNVTDGSAVTNLRSSASGLSWDAVSGATGYVVEYSTDNFKTVVAVETTKNSLDAFALPKGTFRWRVRTVECSAWGYGQTITGPGSTAAEKFVSYADADSDVFFANASGNWNVNYAAEHQSTGETVNLNGKNRLDDIFKGSADANVLVLTDTANGDALFVDDIYTALGNQARFSQIKEIRAGAGNDIVDMTSKRYTYDGSSIKIYGGAGDDTIWGSAKSNTLFGDAGNDRLAGSSGNDYIIGGAGNDSMSGGGGNDVFCFGGNWGKDTVEQLSGSVTLWFDEGSNANWNSQTKTYTDGANSVTVSGNVNVTLKFGADASLPEGAFLDAASEKIFEDKNKGMIA